MLQTAEMPSHTHAVYASDAAPNTPLPTDNVWPAVTEGYAATPNAVMTPAALATTGGQPHENRQPFLALNFVIAVTGIYPSRN